MINVRSEDQKPMPTIFRFIVLIVATVLLGLSLSIEAAPVDNSNAQLLNSSGHAKTEQEIEMAVRAGADPNAVGEDHLSALHLAVMHGTIEAVRVLIRLGANINFKTPNCFTPLDLAQTERDENTDVVELLKANGAVHGFPWGLVSRQSVMDYIYLYLYVYLPFICLALGILVFFYVLMRHKEEYISALVIAHVAAIIPAAVLGFSSIACTSGITYYVKHPNPASLALYVPALLAACLQIGAVKNASVYYAAAAKSMTIIGLFPLVLMYLYILIGAIADGS
jgi:uncharacterized protein